MSARRLLSRLRDLMAGSGTAQDRLDKIVKLIAAEMVAEVCSCYLVRAGEVLELFATVGLNPEAVHKTRLRIGEGIVGDIAAHGRPLALSNAPSHPNFAYRPETGEDPYQSLCGVPLLRNGRVRGVLVIQNRQRRNYVNDEIETLETIAMVVSELVGAGELVNPQEITTASDAGLLPQRIKGTTLSGGLAMGHAVLHQPRLTIREMVAEDPKAELDRLLTAVGTMHSAIDDMVVTSQAIGSGEYADILESYRMFAQDRGWLGRIREAILQGLSAEAAVERVQNETRARLGQVADPYLRERQQDFDDLTNRLLRHLAGKSDEPEMRLPEDAILVARALGPAELLDYGAGKLKGLILEEGGATSHVAIVARGLEIPLITRCSRALQLIEPLDPLIVDGANGQVFIRPSEDIVESYNRSSQLSAERRRLYSEVRDLPAVTQDGEHLQILINASLQIEVPHLESTGAEGIGLYRTEIPFMVRAEYPDVHQQTELYRSILDSAGGRPVTFRTLDVGGDKTLPYFPEYKEENPAMGWRAIRIGLDRPAMLRVQLRAMIRAAAGKELRVMFPLIAEVAELDSARHLLNLELERARSELRQAPTDVKVGVMLEVPSLLWQLDELLKSVDFISLGTNDLAQYFYAADRNNPRLGQRFDVLSPGFLNALLTLFDRCRAARVPICVCGEMASRPLEAMALIALGARTLSVTPQAVGSIKALIRSLNAGRVRVFLSPLVKSRDHSLRDKLRDFARDHQTAIDDVAVGV
ncbi:MAG TPA: phosphoenolpyruvate--protein phosphotransferase [Alphaproteobacteria bacterium]|nr:phosphoenolpyruvate--protein phosphotransferase [Alphaproteobacteria bacterium]